MSKMQIEAHPSTGTVLHVMHSWGGGLERWVKDYCRTDTSRTNIVLKSVGIPGIPGQRIELYQHIDNEKPCRVWDLTISILATCTHNIDYYFALEEIIHDFNIAIIMVSSLIGHSLDILNTGIQTIIICHDYYPFCPAINIYFGKICSECKLSDLQRCFKSNQYNRFFPGINSSEWILVRKSFMKLILFYKIKLVIPSISVKTNLVALESEFKNANFALIPHGIDVQLLKPFPNYHLNLNQSKINSNRKLKILVLGRLSLHKGLKLFQATYKDILRYGEITLLGCGDEGRLFTGIKGINIISDNYSLEYLSKYIQDISPDIGLLLSVCPETFNYTLSELMLFGVPTLATQLGSFENRIIDELNGFLCLPDRDILIDKIKYLSDNRNLILRVAEYLSQASQRNLQEMIADYEAIFEGSLMEHQNINDSISVNTMQKDLESTQIKIQQLQKSRELNNIILQSMKHNKQSRVPLSQKSKYFDYIKKNFNGIWEFVRKLAIKFELFR